MADNDRFWRFIDIVATHQQDLMKNPIGRKIIQKFLHSYPEVEFKLGQSYQNCESRSSFSYGQQKKRRASEYIPQIARPPKAPRKSSFTYKKTIEQATHDYYPQGQGY